MGGLLWVFLGLLLLMIVARSIRKPLLWLWYGVVYSTVGALALFALNGVGQFFSFSLPINPFTAMVAGGMGIPGLIYLVAIRWCVVV